VDVPSRARARTRISNSTRIRGVRIVVSWIWWERNESHSGSVRPFNCWKILFIDGSRISIDFLIMPIDRRIFRESNFHYYSLASLIELLLTLQRLPRLRLICLVSVMVPTSGTTLVNRVQGKP